MTAQMRVRRLERRIAVSNTLDSALAALLAAPPQEFGRFIGAALDYATERQLKAVSTDTEISRKFFTAQFIEFFDEFIEEADARDQEGRYRSSSGNPIT